MQWIRTHLTIVICSAVSLVSIVLIVLGIVLCDVSEVMGRDRSLVQSLSAVRLRPVNQRVIDHQRAILDNNTRQVDATFKKLAESEKVLVEDEVDKIIDDPDIGEQKKGDLIHLWVHKFKMDGQEVLLGYSWNEDALIITLMNIGPHENFYREAKKRRAADLKIIK